MDEIIKRDEIIDTLKRELEAAKHILDHNIGVANKNARAFKKERDDIIRELRRKYSAIEIAEMVGLTRQRVHQILNEPPVEPWHPKVCATCKQLLHIGNV